MPAASDTHRDARCQMPEYATSQLCVPRRVDQLARPLNAWSLGLFPFPWHPLVHQPSRATLAPLLLFSFLNDDRTDRTDRLTHARLLERQPSAHSWRDTADPALPSTLERPPLCPLNKTPTTRTGFVPSHFSFFSHLFLATVSPLFALCNTPSSLTLKPRSLLLPVFTTTTVRVRHTPSHLARRWTPLTNINMADGSLIMAPGASLLSTALTPVATLHTGGVLDASVTHAMPGSETATLAIASSSASLVPAAKPSMSVLDKGQMIQGIFNGEYCEMRQTMRAATGRSQAGGLSGWQ